MKTSKIIAGLLVMLGFAACEPEESLEEGDLPRCRPDVAYPMYGPPTCTWDSKASAEYWLKPSEMTEFVLPETENNNENE